MRLRTFRDMAAILTSMSMRRWRIPALHQRQAIDTPCSHGFKYPFKYQSQLDAQKLKMGDWRYKLNHLNHLTNTHWAEPNSLLLAVTASRRAAGYRLHGSLASGSLHQ